MKVYFLLSHERESGKAYPIGFGLKRNDIKRYQKRYRKSFPQEETAIATLKMSETAYDELIDSQTHPQIYCPFGHTPVTDDELDHFIDAIPTLFRSILYQLIHIEQGMKRYLSQSLLPKSFDAIYIALEAFSNLQGLELDICFSAKDGWDDDALLEYMVEELTDHPI